MILTIDNLDGAGAHDYSAALTPLAAAGATILLERRLNEPATLKAALCLAETALPVPVRGARVTASSNAGALLFTGYLTLEPEAIYAGEASAGAVTRLHLSAVSDDVLLDRMAGVQPAAGALGQQSTTLLQILTQAVGPGVFSTGAAVSGRSLGVYSGSTPAVWSAHAGAISSAGYAGYRVLNGALTMSELPSAVHAIASDGEALTPSGLKLAPVRDLVNDITCVGQSEPTTLWTELFRGDGTTAAFTLTGAPAALSADHSVLLAEDFTGSTLSRVNWVANDSGSHLSLGANGLVMNGGNGLDGQTTLSFAHALELGGTVVLELESVNLDPASAGVLCGLYAGSTRLANCVAGFNVRQANGQTLLVPLVEAAEQGTPFNVQQGHRYTLRLRLFSTERLRFRQTYYTRVNAAGQDAVTSFGGGLISADLRVVMEVRDLGQSSNTPATVLYDGVIGDVPAQANMVVLNSVQLFGAIGGVRISRAGSLLVRATDASTGTPHTCLVGAAGEGLDCAVASGGTGTVTYYDGRIPAANELVTVQYSGRAQAVGRLADAASIAAEAGRGGSGVSRLIARVSAPVTRSSEDCEAAATALLAVSTDRVAALSGSYTVPQPFDSVDVLPGDVLTVPYAGQTVALLVRSVAITDDGAAPEALGYTVDVANDWAAPLGITLEKSLNDAAVANLPAAALMVVPPAEAGDAPAVPVHVLANLRQMSVTAMTNSILTLDAGTPAPSGGGFEVRRRDSGWGQTSADLVLQSPVRGFDIPRAAFEERFFVRMYDGSSPRLYSRFASAFVTHAAVG